MLMSRRNTLAGLAGLSALILGFGLIGAETQAQQADARPDLVVAVPKLARGLEPGKNGGNVDVRVIHSVFDTLIRRDFVAQAETGKTTLVPGLATSWQRISPTEMVLQLRDDVTWHDGSAFTAEDVAFSFGQERVYGENAPVRGVASTLAELESVDILGPHEVKLTWASPDYLMPHRLANKGAWIVQKAAYEAHRDDTLPTSEWMAKAVDDVIWAPIGTGPYRFGGYTAGESLRLVANDDYFMGAPAAATITFLEVPEVAARIAGLVSGEFDMSADIPPDQLPVLERYDDLQIAPVVRENTHVVVFNTTHPKLADPRIRQALSLGIDRKALVASVWRGLSMTPKGPQLSAFNDMYLDDLPEFAFDPDRARALLAEAGFDGSPITLRYIPGYYTLGSEAVQILQAMWAEIGVTIELMPMENWKAMRDADTMLYTWSNTYRFPDPLGQLTLAYGPRSAIQTRYGYWQSDRFNALAAELESTIDLDARRAAFREAAEIYLSEVPSTFLYNPADIYAIRNGISYTPTPQFFEDFRPDNLKILGTQ